MENDMKKRFYNERSGGLYKTLKEAKESSPNPYVYRAWVSDEGNILEKYPVFAYGDMVCRIKDADQRIEEKLKNKNHEAFHS